MANPLVGPSGPSVYAKRTDVGTPEMKMGSIAYGEGLETSAINTGAPKATTRGVADDVGGRPPSASMAPLVGLYDNTQNPNEPVTNGIDIGSGAGSSSLIMQSQLANRKLSDILAEMIPYDTTGEIQYLYQNALSRGN